MEKYEVLNVIGEGTYGTVVKALHKETGMTVAIKKFKEGDENEHVKKIALREVRMLKLMRHQNIVSLLEFFQRKGRLHLIFEYVDNTILEKIERSPEGLDELTVKRIMFQLLEALKYCHTHNIVHRDVKPENLLISNKGVLKLCDFGFARQLNSKAGNYTDYVSTRWYRAPELLVGDTRYGKEIDIWAVGCLFAELLTGQPLFPGDNDLDTLYKIMKLCGGNLPEKYVTAFQNNPIYQGLDLPLNNLESVIKKKFYFLPDPSISFLKACLVYDQHQRPTCQELLDHPYFDKTFKQTFELELLKILSEELQEKRISNKKHAYSENNTPEPSFLKPIKRDKSPNITPLHAVQIKYDEFVPRIIKQIPSNIRQSKDNERFSSLFPEISTRRDEESPLKKPSMKKLQKLSILKPKDVKHVFEPKKQMPHRSRNPSMVYDNLNPNDSFYRASFVSPTLSHRNRNFSKQEINPSTPGERNSMVFPQRYSFKRQLLNESHSNIKQRPGYISIQSFSRRV
ncbi:CDKL2_2 [Blepharisma stoltei]|uniref:Cyclin-dependent kinase 2 homolog n=1 Tax=Blepharisma stoltei TaxID=1481888 RepID=A0AAU9IX16_9CILI|nr:unnamed protein product [Blepharisma stoltei]